SARPQGPGVLLEVADVDHGAGVGTSRNQLAEIRILRLVRGNTGERGWVAFSEDGRRAVRTESLVHVDPPVIRRQREAFHHARLDDHAGRPGRRGFRLQLGVTADGGVQLQLLILVVVYQVRVKGGPAGTLHLRRTPALIRDSGAR